MPPAVDLVVEGDIYEDGYEYDYDLPENYPDTSYPTVVETRNDGFLTGNNGFFTEPKTKTPEHAYFTFPLENTKSSSSPLTTKFDHYLSQILTRPHFDKPPAMVDGWLENMHFFNFMMFFFALYLIFMILCAFGSCDDICCSCLASKKPHSDGINVVYA